MVDVVAFAVIACERNAAGPWKLTVTTGGAAKALAGQTKTAFPLRLLGP